MFPQVFSRFYIAKDDKAIRTAAWLYPTVVPILFLFPVIIGVYGNIIDFDPTLVDQKSESDNIARYQYCMPVMDPEMERDLDNGKVVLGGCCVTDDDPEWQCNECEYDW